MKELSKAILAGGCFWCTEAVFQRLRGVISVKSGYTGGETKNPTYDQVSSGTTGHAEAIQIEFDPTLISYKTLLDVFWATHDPTTLNQQGADVGTQYRSVIFYVTDTQKEIAEKSKQKAQKNFKDPIVTEIVPLTEFYEAEDYHADFYNKNREYGYCRIIIDPKVKKLLEKFPENVKKV